MQVMLLDLGLELRGGQLQVLYLARVLERMYEQGEPVEAVVACPRDGALAAALRKENLPCLPLPGHSATNPLVLFTLWQAIRRRRISILHTQDAQAATIGAVCKGLFPAVRLVHARRMSYPIHRGLRGKKYFIADALIGVSQEIADGLIAEGLPEDKVYAIHSGIDPALYVPKIERGDGRFVFGAVGALTEQKGFGVLIQAMSVLAGIEDLPQWEVRIVGEGPLFDHLLDLAREQKVEASLALFGRQDSKHFLPYFDALLVPSVDGEGSSAVIKEGWAVGLPVVCSALPSNKELVDDKHNGLVVPRGNPLALGAAMLRLIREPLLRERLVGGGGKSLEPFTAEHMAEDTLALYRTLLGIREEPDLPPELPIV
jgi:glycosyltransferase involved in cell wall biosynthesis